MRLVVLTLAICFSSSATSESNDVSTDDLAWLSGNWVGEHDGSVMEEVISKPNAGLMLGFSRIFNDGSTEFFEFMQFKDTENGLVFCPPHSESQGWLSMLSPTILIKLFLRTKTTTSQV